MPRDASAAHRAAFRRLAIAAKVRLNLLVNKLIKPTKPGSPRNPGVHDLVQAKRRRSSLPNLEDAKRGFRGWHERGYLPHRDEPGLVQFVTFRLNDSFPARLRSEWEHLAKIEDDRERRTELEAYLDKGRGQCYLQRDNIAQLVENNFREHAGERYELRAWVIMPNHVHILFKVRSVPMSETVGAWKKHTGRLANQFLEKQGAFWTEDYFDMFMRRDRHEQQTIRYIENNPAKARLMLNPKDWPRSSARFRNEYGDLRL